MVKEARQSTERSIRNMLLAGRGVTKKETYSKCKMSLIIGVENMRVITLNGAHGFALQSRRSRVRFTMLLENYIVLTFQSLLIT